MKQGRPPKEHKNAAIVLLHKLDPKYFTLYRIAKILGLAKQGIHEVWKRDQNKYHLKGAVDNSLDNGQVK